jgi:GH15 family glucan-1,4-alpha-glucosidase
MSRATGGSAASARARAALREEGYLQIRDYGAIGDGRTVALIGRDGTVDWLCLPNLDSPSVFGALLDPQRGGRFELAPEQPFEAEHRYVPDSNVLETTFSTSAGVVRVTDAMSLPRAGLAPQRELLRRIEGLAGEVAMRWRIEPRFGYGQRRGRVARRAGIPVASAGADAIAASSWDAGSPRLGDGTLGGDFVTAPGSRALIALAGAHAEPLILPGRREAEARLDETIAFWQRWARARTYEGPWREAVIRSALALKLLVFAPSGAIAAAATTSLPEQLGGERNWDYRFSWVRDAAFTLDAFLALGCPAEAHAYFWWLSHASQLTHPRVRVLYRLDGRAHTPERELALAGYAGSRPVRAGNAAGPQRQLDVYGELLQTAHRYALGAGRLDRDTAHRLAGLADEVCELWREPDTGIWEVRSEPRHFTQSKVMCWVALDCAAALAEEGHIPARSSERWRRESEEIVRFIEGSCWSRERGSYVRFAGADELDASLPFTAIMGYRPPDEARIDRTLDAVRDELAVGPLLHRYRGEDGLSGDEGAFLACSFWLAEALARRRRLDEAAQLMDQLIAVANDLGLYAEEIDPSSGAFLGNFPQALVHLALINAAAAYREAERG